MVFLKKPRRTWKLYRSLDTSFGFDPQRPHSELTTYSWGYEKFFQVVILLNKRSSVEADTSDLKHSFGHEILIIVF